MVSVIIPAYNSANYLRNSLDSVVKQDYLDLEIIIVDDGSTDNTKELLEEYNDDRIKYFYKENGGLSSARNYGIERANGKYIAFLDADDIWEKDKVSRQVKYLEEHENIGVVSCNFQYIDEEGNDLNVFNVRDLYPKDGFNLYSLLRCCFLVPSSVIMRSKIINDLGAFDKDYDWAEDIGYFLKVLEKYELGVIDEVLLRYRTGHASLSRGFRSYNVRERVLDDFWKKRKLNANEELCKAVTDSYANLYIQHGTGLLWSGDMKGSRVYFVKSLKYKKTLRSAYLYLKSYIKELFISITNRKVKIWHKGRN